MKLSQEDRMLRDYLAGGDSLSIEYARAADEEPGHLLDEAVLSAARPANDALGVRRRDLRTRYFGAGLAVAALAILAVSLVVTLPRDHQADGARPTGHAGGSQSGPAPQAKNVPASRDEPRQLPASPPVPAPSTGEARREPMSKAVAPLKRRARELESNPHEIDDGQLSRPERAAQVTTPDALLARAHSAWQAGDERVARARLRELTGRFPRFSLPAWAAELLDRPKPADPR